MGLNISHGTWNGAYSAFMRWRKEIAKAIGMPPLELMDGFYDEVPFTMIDIKMGRNTVDTHMLDSIRSQMPIKWESLKRHDLHILLNHSDCDGYITAKQAAKIANELEKLLPKIEGIDLGGHIGDMKVKTQLFIDGCRLAHSKNESLKFR